MKAKVVAVYGAYYGITVEGSPEVLLATLKGNNSRRGLRKKENPYTVGDYVEVKLLADNKAVIEQILPRKNCVKRSSTRRLQLLGANLDQVLFIGAWAAPRVNFGLFDRVLVEVMNENVNIAIVLNKEDLKQDDSISTKAAVYKDIGIQIFSETFSEQVSPEIKNYIHNKRSLLLGESGSGKSTFLNAVANRVIQEVGEVSKFQSGRHTTTNPVLHIVDQQTELIDIPGFKEFGLAHYEARDILKGYPEFEDVNCQYRNCLHVNEVGCGLDTEEARSHARYESYLSVLNSLNQNWKPRRGDYFR